MKTICGSAASKLFGSFVLLVGFCSTSLAAPIFLNPGDPSGFDTGCSYLGTFAGNDDIGSVETALSLLDLYLIDKSDNGGQTNFKFDGAFIDPDGSYSGTWEYVGPLANPVFFMSIKAGNQFALYQYLPSRSSGNWSTENLGVGGPNGDRNIPALSHLSFFGRDIPSTEIPEPGSVLLLGSGLLGLFGARRRKA